MPDRAVLFDLDGTLADTAPDMGHAINLVLQAHGRPPLPQQTIRPHVSHGGKALIKLAFDATPEDPRFPALREAFLAAYQANIHDQTTLFPGVEELLDALEARGLAWGVVTNKPAWLTDPLMRSLGIGERAACIISGDTTAHSKPHPEPILHACELIGEAAKACWYVGDAQRDIQAGLAAGTRTLVAMFGYLGQQDQPAAWGAHGMIEHPLDILDWLDD